MIKNYIVTEYSVSQDCFHVETLRDALFANSKTAFAKASNDYLIIGVFETEKEAHEYTDVFRKALIDDKRGWVDHTLKNIFDKDK